MRLKYYSVSTYVKSEHTKVIKDTYGILSLLRMQLCLLRKEDWDEKREREGGEGERKSLTLLSPVFLSTNPSFLYPPLAITGIVILRIKRRTLQRRLLTALRV